MENNLPRLSRLAPSLKVLVTCFVVSLMVGYLVALLQVFNRTHFDLAHTLGYYRGDGGGEEALLLPQSFATLLSVAHVHTFSQPVMLALMGFVFCFSYVSEKAKIIFVLLSFIGSLVSNAAPWLIRYASPKAAILLPLSQMVLMLSFFVMAFVVLADLWMKRDED